MCEHAILEAMLHLRAVKVEPRTDVPSGYLIDGGAIRIETRREIDPSRSLCRIDAAGRCYRVPYRTRFVEERGYTDIRFTLDDLVAAYEASIPASEAVRDELDRFLDDGLPAIFLAAMVQEAHGPRMSGGALATVAVDVDGVRPGTGLWLEDT
ncbi:hypothetical protein FF100_05465 [Methylobacterium terricola]|uniref:Uncharacterized protein n=1 Tax=Methylobacterium terricola TaxID=2583531 RepID=A0A5C4LKJ2_9HYPH|nr:hypothetical protein [Methylobacterium terricola]TNC15016.1 hypothetical protein FF100_05465 [Methylobacterium terricola]